MHKKILQINFIQYFIQIKFSCNANCARHNQTGSWSHPPLRLPCAPLSSKRPLLWCSTTLVSSSTCYMKRTARFLSCQHSLKHADQTLLLVYLTSMCVCVQTHIGRSSLVRIYTSLTQIKFVEKYINTYNIKLRFDRIYTRVFAWCL